MSPVCPRVNPMEMHSDEDYVISRAKAALNNDPYTAKAWLITAKTLFPDNFSVQFEAYKIEKNSKNVKEAAKCLSDILGQFHKHEELWQEVNAMTSALRCESDKLTIEMKFFTEMFQHIPTKVQHQILLITADHCEDTMEHCRLLLLLLKRFPQTVTSHGPKLVDTLLTAEKHSHSSDQPLNNFRKLLVCELLPLFGASHAPIDLPLKLWYRLLNKTIEFYFYIITTPSSFHHENDPNLEKPWHKLFSVLELIGRNLSWETSLISFHHKWNKDSYWQKILNFYHAHKTVIEDQNVGKQLLYCLTTFFLYCLHEYMTHQVVTTNQTNINMLLVESFTDPTLPRPASEPKSKRRKTEDSNVPHMTIDKPGSSNLINIFLMTFNCWELLHSKDFMEKEFTKLTSNLKLEAWLNSFILDSALYKGHYETALTLLNIPGDAPHSLTRYLRIACINYFQKQYSPCFEHILLIIGYLQPLPPGHFSKGLMVGGLQRHLHFIPLTQSAVLQYCVRILISAIKENMNKQINGYNDLLLGNLLVLLQLDWPQQEDVLPIIIQAIQQRGNFHYPLLQSYVINIDILEELMYLWTDQGGNAMLDIFLTPQSISQRRIGTRGADKGVKEDFKQAMRKQVARNNEPIDQLVIKFITAERIHVLQSLM